VIVRMQIFVTGSFEVETDDPHGFAARDLERDLSLLIGLCDDVLVTVMPKVAGNVDVVCSQCGHILKGTPATGGGYVVRKHKRNNSTLGCFGYHLTNHQPKVETES
jgi:hypothetical protein